MEAATAMEEWHSAKKELEAAMEGGRATDRNIFADNARLRAALGVARLCVWCPEADMGMKDEAAALLRRLVALAERHCDRLERLRLGLAHCRVNAIGGAVLDWLLREADQLCPADCAKLSGAIANGKLLQAELATRPRAATSAGPARPRGKAGLAPQTPYGRPWARARGRRVGKHDDDDDDGDDDGGCTVAWEDRPSSPLAPPCFKKGTSRATVRDPMEWTSSPDDSELMMLPAVLVADSQRVDQAATFGARFVTSDCTAEDRPQHTADAMITDLQDECSETVGRASPGSTFGAPAEGAEVIGRAPPTGNTQTQPHDGWEPGDGPGEEAAGSTASSPIMAAQRYGDWDYKDDHDVEPTPSSQRGPVASVAEPATSASLAQSPPDYTETPEPYLSFPHALPQPLPHEAAPDGVDLDCTQLLPRDTLRIRQPQPQPPQPPPPPLL
jgi:hypothetical protein